MSEPTFEEISGSEFASLMAPFGPLESNPVLAVGVSGGRDSLSLALLSHEWARPRGGRVLALIVDHGLRAEAAAEAATTSALLAEHGIASEILRWHGKKPVAGLQEAARSARYELLFEACRRQGIIHLLIAHHADDQAETIDMRAARASGPDGLAGMAALVEHRDGRLLRPLLAIPRHRLTATLAARGIHWIEDPSNADPRFERSRLRLRARTAVPNVAGDRATQERLIAEIAVETLAIDPPDTVAFDQAVFAGLDRSRAARLLGRIVQAVGKRNYPPRRERLDHATARLFERPNRGKSGKSQDFTLSECRLALRQSPNDRRLRWIVKPENGRKSLGKTGQPLFPAVFFACGTQGTTHLD